MSRPVAGSAGAPARPGRPAARVSAAGAIALALTATLYLGYSFWLNGTIGFPLDDAWIHQTFARSIAAGQGLAFNPGEPVAGTTGPLWTALIALGHRAGIDGRVWTIGLGLAALALTAALAARMAIDLTGRDGAGPITAGAVLIDWRLDWAALSGMETVLFAGLALAGLSAGLGPTRRPWLAGLAGGLATLGRPEGIVLIALVSSLLLLGGRPADRTGSRRASWSPGAAGVCLGCGLAVAGIGAAANWWAGGQALPNTFAAKTDFYGAVGSWTAALGYLAGAADRIFLGPTLVLLPGLAGAIARSVRGATGGRGVLVAGLALWALALPLLYLVRLPVLYHHGRYLLPVLPPLAILAVWGGVWLVERLPYRRLIRWYPWIAGAFYLALWLNGAQVYAWGVKYIEDEHVTVARWLRDSTAPDAVIATHDVGAIGYFSGRRVIDLAGLVTPDLIGHTRDEAYLDAYLRRRRAGYLAILPDWYPGLAAGPNRRLIFSVDRRYVREAGGTDFHVYRLEL